MSFTPQRWIGHEWDEEDLTFYFELASDGIVLRQIEVVTSSGRVNGAAALEEVTSALREGGVDAVRAYERRYGALADQPLSEPDGPIGRPVSRESFESFWSEARAELEARSALDGE